MQFWASASQVMESTSSLLRDVVSDFPQHFIAHSLAFPVHLLWSCAECRENVLGHSQCHFAFSGKYANRPRFLHHLRISKIVRSHKYLNVWIGVAGETDDFGDLLWSWSRDDESDRGTDAGAVENLFLRGISINSAMTIVRHTTDRIGVRFDDDGFDSPVTQQPGQRSADGSITNDNSSILRRYFAHWNCLRWPDQPVEDGVQGDGYNGGCNQCVRRISREDA